MDIIRSVPVILFLVFLFSTQNTMCSLGMNIICKESERIALLSFKQHLKDYNYSLSSWSGENCCMWVGVRCNNRTGHVIKLELHGLVLGGEVNPVLQELKQLRYLDLSMNYFEGSIPDFLGSLQSLRYLDLHSAGYNGKIPHQLGNLSNLRYLNVGIEDNGYEAVITIPPQLGNLSNLRYLDISYSSDYDLPKPCSIAGNFHWLSHLSSLQHLNLNNVNLKNASNCLHAISLLPSLLGLYLSNCGLDALPSLSVSIGNLTKLTELALSYNDLEGQIPVTLENLFKLQILEWKSNQLKGEIPGFVGNLCNLQSLDLSGNKLNGEISGFLGSSIGCITNSLKSLVLSDNQLSGPLPDELGRLRNLTNLDLSDNSFTGSIPCSMGSLSFLEVLDLSYNKLNGSVPECLGNFSNLTRLAIAENAFEGVISEIHFANLTNLQQLFLNSLVLKISPYWVPSFQLFAAGLKNCQLGAEFPTWIRTQKNLNQINLSKTGISGTIPPWFWNLTNQDFSFDLSHNNLHGKLPKVINARTIYLRSNRFNGELPLVSSRVEELDLSNNSFSVPISTFLCNTNISESNYLQILDLSNNRLSGDLSDCWAYWTNLRSLRLGGNKITGKIPSSMGSLVRLGELHLQKNTLSGELPSSLRNCTSLYSIDFGENGLTGRLPIWLGETLQRLQFLRLRSNKFYDEIPLEFCHLASIQVLDIAHNGLRGSIPRCFSNFSAISTKETPGISVRLSYFGEYYEETTLLVMKGMELGYGTVNIRYVTSLDLSTNRFSGEIPEEITNLIGLRSLNLSENCFRGKIPDKIGNMSLLESLDFSNNNISGIIPASISRLSSLSHLNLSYNNLSGTIPLSTQLQSFNEFSFIGNQDLCGLPFKNCKGEESPQELGARNKEEEDEVWMEMKWFYISTGVGLVVGFWTFWGAMILKKSWRIAYFRFMDDMKDKLLF